MSTACRPSKHGGCSSSTAASAQHLGNGVDQGHRGRCAQRQAAPDHRQSEAEGRRTSDVMLHLDGPWSLPWWSSVVLEAFFRRRVPGLGCSVVAAWADAAPASETGRRWDLDVRTRARRREHDRLGEGLGVVHRRHRDGTHAHGRGACSNSGVLIDHGSTGMSRTAGCLRRGAPRTPRAGEQPRRRGPIRRTCR